MVNKRLTERDILLRRRFKKVIELQETIERRRSDKIKGPRSQRGLLSYLRRNFSAQIERNPLAGSAQIVS
jgi:hypothetical protein